MSETVLMKLCACSPRNSSLYPRLRISKPDENWLHITTHTANTLLNYQLTQTHLFPFISNHIKTLMPKVLSNCIDTYFHNKSDGFKYCYLPRWHKKGAYQKPVTVRDKGETDGTRKVKRISKKERK